ncbi:MAG: Ferrochelatase [Verrucomicrobia bacterium ADurb.Bin122]|nr:MAG: Ferrochelatase [Verrucomicrobia bacterium ADurb.Bin122]
MTKALAEFARLAPHIQVTTVPPFYADADYIEALHAVAAPYLAQPHDHVLFSYHGIPIRHLRKADPTHAHCTASADCCTTPSPAHATCYKAQCLATTRALAARAGLAEDGYSVAFQSRLVGEPWLAPYTDAELKRLAEAGKRRLLVLTPAFVTDCLETLEEIAVTGRESFLAAGGNCFQHIPCLNDHPAYIDFLAKRTESWLSGDPTQLKRAASQTDSPCRRDLDPCGG